MRWRAKKCSTCKWFGIPVGNGMKASSTSLTHTHMEIKYTSTGSRARFFFLRFISFFYSPPPFYSVPFSCKSSSSSHVDVPGTRWLPEMTILCKFRGQLSSSSFFLYFISSEPFPSFESCRPPIQKSPLPSTHPGSFLGCHCRRCRGIAGHQKRCKSSAGFPISRGWHHSFYGWGVTWIYPPTYCERIKNRR